MKNEKIIKVNENYLNYINKKPEKHGKCVPLELYQKVYNDRKELLKKVNNFNLVLKQKENEKIKLEAKLKKYEKDSLNSNIILLNQEKYVEKLNKKIEKLEKIIIKLKEEIISKENEIILSKEKFEEFKNNLENYKNLAKLDYQQKIEQTNNKINLLNKEIELKDNHIKNFEKKYKYLQEKYLKTLNQKNMKEQENVYKVLKRPLFNKKFKISQSNEDIFNFITLNSNTISQVDSIREKYNKKYDDLLVIENDDEINENDFVQINEYSNKLPNINKIKRNKYSKDKK